MSAPRQYEIESDLHSLERFQRGEESLTEETPAPEYGLRSYYEHSPVKFRAVLVQLSPLDFDLLYGYYVVGATWRRLAQLLSMAQVGTRSTGGISTPFKAACQRFTLMAAGRECDSKERPLLKKLYARDPESCGGLYVRSARHADEVLTPQARWL